MFSKTQKRGGMTDNKVTLRNYVEANRFSGEAGLKTLALVDAIRVGGPKESKLAIEMLKKN